MIDFNRDYILENERVKLTPLTESDYHNLLPFALHEPDIWRYSLIQAGSPEKLKIYIEKAISDRKNKYAYPFLVFDKLTKAYAGSTRFYDIQIDNLALQLGFTWYGKTFQGTGLNKHCKYLLLAFAFEELGFMRVEFRADEDNKRSIAAMKSIGCKTDGILRSNAFKPDGTRRNSIVLSILEDEWTSEVKKQLFLKLKK
ncbi:MAG: GNAT family N-acetyltransferase [Bacteroidia bacterium]|jgi:RimJ/RimL family protein N-acetyltransferase|nr:GNAT family N-acetyltransferase [Bacteroidia bacterium]